MEFLKEKSHGLSLVFGVAVVAGIAFLWYIVGRAFYNVTGDTTRAGINATLYCVGVLFAVISNLRADDERTASLSKQLVFVLGGLGVLMFLGSIVVKNVGGDISKLSEIEWLAIPLTYGMPVLVATLVYVVKSLDVFWGEDKPRNESPFLRFAYAALYNVALVSGLMGAGLGTYDFAYHLTGSEIAALTVVGSIEVAIFVGATWSHKTADKDMFWHLFTFTLAIFGVSFVNQVLDSIIKAVSGDGVAALQDNELLNQIAFVFPVLVLGALLYLFQLNQRKAKRSKGQPQFQNRQPQRESQQRREDNRGNFPNQPRPRPQEPQRQQPQQIPFVVTAQQRNELLELGFSDAEINKMTPQQVRAELQYAPNNGTLPN